MLYIDLYLSIFYSCNKFYIKILLLKLAEGYKDIRKKKTIVSIYEEF